MPTLKKKAVVVFTLLAVFAISGAAFAASDDTVINYGYDEDSKFFMWNVTSLDYEPYLESIEDDETISADDLAALVEACGLDPEGLGTEYDYTAQLSDDGESVDITLSNDEGELDNSACGGFTGDFVTGPNGQVNHGMFMKTFNELYDGPHRGCVVRHIARSSLGKDEQQIKAGEEPIEDDGDGSDVVAEGTVTISTAISDCLHGKDEKEAEEELESDQRRGPPQHVLDKFEDGHPGKGNKGDNPGKGKP